jgi:hypothetical protein
MQKDESARVFEHTQQLVRNECGTDTVLCSLSLSRAEVQGKRGKREIDS